MSWEPASVDWVVGRLHLELESLHPAHRRLLEPLLVEPRSVPVESCPGETVVVVAQHGDRILYWSDVEDGWELEQPTSAGGIPERGCNQFELSHIAWQLFGDPVSLE